MKFTAQIKDMTTVARSLGLKRLKIGSIEIELSDYTTALDYSKAAEAANLTPIRGDSAHKAPTTPDEPTAMLDEEDDDALLFHSSDP